MAGTEALCHMPEGHARVIAPTWFQRFRGLMVVTVGQIEKPLGNAGGGAVGRHIDERHRDLRHRLVAGESEWSAASPAVSSGVVSGAVLKTRLPTSSKRWSTG